MYMARNVALSNDAYLTLEKLKRPGESFSVVVKRLASEKTTRSNWRDCVGLWKDDPGAERIFNRILEERHQISRRPKIKW